MSKKIAILGAGESGTGSAILAKKMGFTVFLSDLGTIKPNYIDELRSHNIAFEQGQHTAENILDANEIIKSPGIPDSAPLINIAREKGINIISELEFASRFTSATLIAISGTNGKTTTTSLLYHTLKQAGLNVGLGGNIGKSFARQVAQENFDVYVLEVSSFQLDGNYTFHAHIAILTNITPDHLDRYGYDVNKYIASKFRLTLNQTVDDYFFYCADDELTVNNMHKFDIQAQTIPFTVKNAVETGAYSLNNQLIVQLKNSIFDMNTDNMQIGGIHNRYNSLAAALAAKALNVKNSAIRDSFESFTAIEHRLEKVKTISGISFINDSKATNVNSTWYALESIEKPIIWIAGGVDKGNDYNQIANLVRDKVKFIICLGIDNRKIHQYFQGIVPMIINTLSAKEAVHVARKLGVEGDTVLLSPACASFDLFDDYEDRGRQFKKAVGELY